MTFSQSVTPSQGLAPWIGGKRNLAAAIISRIAAIPHVCYAEPFVGMGGVFLRRCRRPRVEVINDLNHDVATTFRVVQRHPDALIDCLSGHLASREVFAALRAVPSAGLTDVERAARLIYLQYSCYGGRPVRPAWGYSALSRPGFVASRIVALVRRVHRRLAGVYIDCGGWEQFIGRWDRPTTLFYLDPPYWGAENYYGDGLFAREDFARLAAALRRLRGQFILSLNDHPEVRTLFAWADIQALETVYTVSGGDQCRRGRELLIGSPHGEK